MIFVVKDRMSDARSFGVYMQECGSQFEKRVDPRGPCANEEGEDYCLFGFLYEDGYTIR